MENLFLLITVGIFAAFLAFFWTKNGVQTSISATYKLLLKACIKNPENRASVSNGNRSAHTIWIMLFFILAIGIISSGQTGWHLGSAVGLLGVGAFPEYWEKDQIRKHFTAAYFAFALPIIKMAFFSPGWILSALAAVWFVFAVLISFKLIKIPYKTTVLEITGFVVIVLGLCL